MKKKSKIAFLVILLYIGIPISYAFGLTNILNIRRWTGPDHTRIVIDVSDKISYRTTENNKIVSLDLENTAIPSTLSHEYLVDKPAVKKISLSSLPGNTVRVELHVGDDATVKIFTLGPIRNIKPHRVVIDVKLPAIEKKESEERKQIKIQEKIQEKRKIIVIDPGHGGEDPGAVGRKGPKEKNIVLRVAKSLRNILKKKGYQAYLTREGDYYISFKKRLEIAREYGADLFISIHTDAHRSRGARGASVYCLSTGGASNEAARLLARNENLSDIIAGVQNGETNGEADHITLNMLQTETINLSKRLGVEILGDLKRVNHLKYSKVHEAPFRILKLPEIPSILVEIAYISNPREEYLLRKSSYRKEVAWALASSVHDFVPLPPSLARETTFAMPVEAVVSSGQTPRSTEYVVKRGDILARIAAKHGTSVRTLQRLNKLRRSDRILVGQKLKIPSTTGMVQGEYIVHVVKKGDMLETIATRYDTSTGILMRINNLRRANRIYVGQRLKIPTTNGNMEDSKDRDTKPSVYSVKRGDTLAGIADRHDTTVVALMKMNELSDKNSILKGQTLNLRKPDPEETPKAKNGGKNSAVEPVRLRNTIEAVIEQDIKAELKAIKDSNARQTNGASDDQNPGDGVDAIKADSPASDDDRYAVYIVRRGEILDRIARRYNTTAARLMVLNNIKRKNRIFVNQRLKVPVLRRDSSTDDDTNASETSVHSVKRGESLARIAYRYNTTIGVLLKLNNLRLNDTLYVNQQLKVPSEREEFSVYVVRRGDYLSKIAGRNGTTVTELRRLNNLQSKNCIYVGQRLRVPTS